MAVVSGLLPTTGIPLPFLSFGGSSLTLTLFGVGVLMNVSRRAAQAPVPVAPAVTGGRWSSPRPWGSGR
jgi:cell division protein FtsW